MNTIDSYAVRIAAAHPELQAALDEHLDYYEELLPTLWLSDVARWCASRFIANDVGPLQEVLAAVERAWLEASAGDRNTIAAGFVEHLPAPYQLGGGLSALLGPNLAELHQTLRP